MKVNHVLRHRSMARMPLPVKPDLAAMEATSVAEIPTGDGWQYEPKWDGFRCLVFRDGGEIELRSKAGQPLGRYFPDVVTAARAIDAKRFVLDGELVIPTPDGRGLSFDALLQRIHPAESRVKKLAVETPAWLVVFDLLVTAKGTSILEQPLRERRPQLEAFAAKFDFSKFKTLCDVGGATGQLSIILANRHPHLKCTTFDLPAVEPIAKRTIEAAGLSDRVEAVGGDFFGEPLPRADVITMGMILHDWNLERKKQLVEAAYDALPQGGAYIVIENIIDDARRENAFGLLMSLNMLIEFGDAFDFTGADFAAWCKEAGFREVDVLPLAGPTSAGIAYK